jgi:hypothetical protein
MFRQSFQATWTRQLALGRETEKNKNVPHTLEQFQGYEARGLVCFKGSLKWPLIAIRMTHRTSHFNLVVTTYFAMLQSSVSDSHKTKWSYFYYNSSQTSLIPLCSKYIFLLYNLDSTSSHNTEFLVVITSQARFFPLSGFFVFFSLSGATKKNSVTLHS